MSFQCGFFLCFLMIKFRLYILARARLNWSSILCSSYCIISCDLQFWFVPLLVMLIAGVVSSVFFSRKKLIALQLISILWYFETYKHLLSEIPCARPLQQMVCHTNRLWKPMLGCSFPVWMPPDPVKSVIPHSKLLTFQGCYVLSSNTVQVTLLHLCLPNSMPGSNTSLWDTTTPCFCFCAFKLKSLGMERIKGERVS